MLIAVTADRYELPLCFGDSQSELARRLGVSDTMIHYALKRGHTSRNKFNNSYYKIVEVQTE